MNGTPMRWIEQGDGPPAVLVHGIPTSPELWRWVLPKVRRGRLLAWEMVGYGRSSTSTPPGTDISVAGQAEHLRAFMDALGIERAVLVGHDLGGGVAQILAARHPERCAGLVLTNAVAYDSWPVPAVATLARPRVRSVLERLPEPLLRPVHYLFIRPGHGSGRIAHESADCHFRGYAGPGGGAALARQAASLRTEDTLAVAGRLPELGVPARIVWGAADRFLKLQYGRRLARDLSAPIDEIPGARHFTPEDHPEHLAAAIQAVIDAAGEEIAPAAAHAQRPVAPVAQSRK